MPSPKLSPSKRLPDLLIVEIQDPLLTQAQAFQNAPPTGGGPPESDPNEDCFCASVARESMGTMPKSGLYGR